MFIHQGIVHFPAIPYLTINDFWRGTGDDAGKLLLHIDRDIWSRDYVIVDIDDYCYTIRGTLGTFRPIPISDMDLFDGTTVLDNVWWVESSVLHNTIDRGWVIDDDSFGEGNYYAVSWNAQDGEVIASPRGPWTDDENPPQDVTMEIDWPRLQISRSYGTVTWYGKYVPATTHVHDSVSGEMTIGMPSWKATIDGDEVVVAKTNAKFEEDEKVPFEYVTRDGFGFKWNADEERLEMDYDGTLYYAGTPTPESSWAWTTEDSEGHTTTLTAIWNGWIGGFSTKELEMFEVARLL